MKKSESSKEKDTRFTLKRDVTFTVNYKGDFSPEEQEYKYVVKTLLNN